MRRFVIPAAIGAAAGGGLGLATNVMPSYWPNAPHWLLGILFWGGLCVTIVPIASILLWHLFARKRRIYGILAILVFFGGAYFALSGVVNITSERWSQLPQPDVAMCLVNAQRPALTLINLSEQIAERVKYQYGLFDLDSSNPNEPLRAMVGTFDFIQPKSLGGPQDIFDSLATGGQAPKDGDRIVGTIAVSCPKCVAGHTYWVSMILGTGGWFSLIDGDTSGQLKAPVSHDPRKPFFSSVELLPLLSSVADRKRIKIADYRTYLTSGRPISNCMNNR
jgi:hypothetical protein